MKKKIILMLFMSVLLIAPMNNYVDAATKKTTTKVTATQTANYTITYNLNGGKNNKSNPKSYSKKTKTIKLKNPTKMGYTFKGWYSDAKLKKKVTSIKKGSTGNKVLYAKWTPNTYTIKFDKNGATSGKMSNKKNVKYGSPVKLGANKFSKKGYIFAGWNTKKNGKGKTYANNTSVKNLVSKNKGTITLYAIWKNEFKITYNLNGGRNNKSNPSKYKSTKEVVLKNPTRSGYKFLGWYTDSKYKNKVTKIAKGKTGNITLYAKWQSTVSTKKQQALSKAKWLLSYAGYSKAYLQEQLKIMGFSSEEAKYAADNCGANWKEQALKSAKDYLSHMNFSYQGLLDQLKFEKYTYDEAKYAVDKCGANWKEQAVAKAKDYLKHSDFSYEGLIKQLEFEKFTAEEAKYGVDNCGAVWEAEVVKSAKKYLEISAFSYEGLKSQLEFEGYTTEEAKYGVDNCGANWKEQAVKAARDYLDNESFSYEGLIKQLEFEKFTAEEAKYGVEQLDVDWNYQAVRCAQSYLELFDYSYEELISQLEFEGFTTEQAEYAAEMCITF